MRDEQADSAYRPPDQPITANQLVAYNLMRVRKSWGWSQEKAAEQLEPYLGVRWSKAVYSAAERSYRGSRVRQFTADEVLAMSRAFGVPVQYFFLPPPEDDREGADGVLMGASGRPVNWHDLLLAGFSGEEVWIMPRLRELPEGEVPDMVWMAQGAPAHRDAILKEIEDIRAEFFGGGVDDLRESLKQELMAELDKRLPPSGDGDGP